LLVAAPGVQAAQWRGTVHLDASETFTDNVSLTPAASAKSDFITQISPGFSLRGVGPRLDVSVDYSLQSFVYARDSDLNHTSHQLAASAKSALVRNFLFLDAQAAISQQNISLLGPVGVNDNNASDANRSSVRTYLVSPFIRDRLGSYANYEVRYQYDNVSSNSDSLSNSSANKYSATITSGPAFNRYTWDVKVYKETDYYQEGEDQGQENVTGNLRYFLTPRLALTGSGGYEKFDFPTVGNKPEGSFWSAGIFWRPSTLTSLSLSGGHRFYGPSYALDFSHRSRHLVWRWSYNETINTTRSNFVNTPSLSTFDFLSSLVGAGISDPTQRALLINQLIAQRGLPSTLPNAVNFFSNRTFLEKRADGSITYNSGKTTSVLSIFRDIRDTNAIGSLSTTLFGADDFDASNNIRQQGASFLFNWAFWPKTNADINVGYNDTLFRDSDREERLKFIRLGLRHQMTPKMTGAVDYRYTKRDSNVPAADYKENAVDASVNVRF
jgi:uncharacterized protein (PEP-CTERM system associated)